MNNISEISLEDFVRENFTEEEIQAIINNSPLSRPMEYVGRVGGTALTRISKETKKRGNHG